MSRAKGDKFFRCGYAKDATGGEGGEWVYPQTTAELITHLASPDSRYIILGAVQDYNLEGRTVFCRSNKTIIGDVGSTIKRGELRIQDASNVVIYHVRFRDPVGDCITVRNSDLVHINQCTFDQGTSGSNKSGGKADGAVDIVGCDREQMRVTVANSKFLRFHKAHLIGWDQASDARILATLYRNWYRANRRIPQCNRSMTHIRNCVMDWQDECCASYAKAHLWVDRNFITDKRGKGRYCGKYKSSTKDNGYIGFSGNLYKNCKPKDNKKSKAKAAKAHWDTMPRLSKSWSSAQKIRNESGMLYR